MTRQAGRLPSGVSNRRANKRRCAPDTRPAVHRWECLACVVARLRRPKPIGQWVRPGHRLPRWGRRFCLRDAALTKGGAGEAARGRANMSKRLPLSLAALCVGVGQGEATIVEWMGDEPAAT